MVVAAAAVDPLFLSQLLRIGQTKNSRIVQNYLVCSHADGCPRTTLTLLTMREGREARKSARPLHGHGQTMKDGGRRRTLRKFGRSHTQASLQIPHDEVEVKEGLEIRLRFVGISWLGCILNTDTVSEYTEDKMHFKSIFSNLCPSTRKIQIHLSIDSW